MRLLRVRCLYVVVCLACFESSAVAQNQTAGKTLSVRGPVDWERPAWVALPVNQVLDIGAHIRTGQAGRAVVLLVDETQLKINDNTDLRLTSVKAPTTLFQRMGQAAGRSQESVMSVSKGRVWLRATNKPTDVKLSTPAVTAAIRGTEFDMRVADDGETIVTVIDGVVDLSNAQGALLVNSGEQGRARVGEAPTKTLLVNPLDAVQWTISYLGAVSPRDYPVRYATIAAARTAATQPGLAGVALAEARHDAGDREGALQALGNVATPETADIRGWVLLEQNQALQALTQFDLVQPPTSRSRLGRALTLWQLGRYEPAFRELEGVTDSRAAVQRAQMNLLGGDPIAAQAALEAIPAADEAYGAAQGLLSTVHLVQNRKDEAREAAVRATRARPDQPSAFLALSLVEQSFFNLPAAIAAAERARALAPGFVQADVQLATLLFGTGETGRAYELMQQVVARAPGEATAQSTLGFILLSRGRETEARAALNEAIRLDSTLGEPRLGLGILNMRQGQLENAVEEIIQAALLDPRRSLYQSYLASALYDLRRFEEAFGALRAAKRLDPRDPTPYLYAGLFLKDLNRPVEAIREIDTSIRLNDGRAVYRSRFLLDGDSAAGNVHLSRAYDVLGLAEWANEAAINSATADPTNSSSHLLLGDTFARLDNRAQAAGSEDLVARLLQPVNLNAFNSFNSYTTLYSRPKADWYLEAMAGNFETSDGYLKAYGGNSRIAYLADVEYYGSNGYQLTNGDEHYVNGSLNTKIALNRDTDFLLGYGADRNRGGEVDESALVSVNNYTEDRYVTTNQWFEAGAHRRLRPGSELLGTFSFSADTSRVSWEDGSEFDTGTEWSAQFAHILVAKALQLRYGVEYFRGHEAGAERERADAPDTGLGEFIDYPFDPEPPVAFAHAYSIATLPVSRRWTLTGGLTFDTSPVDNEFGIEERRLKAWSPQAGILFRPFQSTTLRGVYIDGVQTHEFERLGPTHVFGFPTSADNIRYTDSRELAIGWDQRIGGHSFTRLTVFRRKLSTPYVYYEDDEDETEVADKYPGLDYGMALAFNHVLGRRLSLTAQYDFRNEDHLLNFNREHRASLMASYVSPSGLQLAVRQNYVSQRGYFTDEEPTYYGDFYTDTGTVDASVKWDFPRKRGFVAASVNNLTDRTYEYLHNPLSWARRPPRREVSVIVGVYF